MNRIPPGLLYLTIYNPTLHPDSSVSADDEDAEEQAHILFYTARERAVSRDKILRQVGLAKALINFSSMFNSADVCENVHSQSRRMVMISPEPNFWIHACLEIARTPRSMTPKGKGKAKGSESSTKPETAYDYHDGSIYDLALRKHILNGYEQFKLTHGSFSSILTSLGQQALELQLERFFTVWAWKWDVEADLEFSEHLGVPLHPLHRPLTLILDEFAQHLTPSTISFALIPPYTVPSSKLLLLEYPDVLIRHILSRIPPPPPRQMEISTPEHYIEVHEEGRETDPKAVSTPDGSRPSDHHKGAVNPFDVRNLKWVWNGLTFGKGSSAKSTGTSTPALSTTVVQDDSAVTKLNAADVPELKIDGAEEQKLGANVEVEIDTESLRDAIASEHVHSPASRASSVLPTPTSPSPVSLHIPEIATTKELDEGDTEDIIPQYHLDAASPSMPDSPVQGDEKVERDATGHTLSSEEGSKPVTEATVTRPDPPVLLSTSIHLADTSTPLSTKRMKVLHGTIGNLTVAFVVEESHGYDLKQLSEQSLDLLQDIQKHLTETEEQRELDKSLPSLSKILVPRNKHVVASGAFTSPGPVFGPTSGYLFRGQELLHSDLDVREVFSRGQNPQHWHISRRGIGTGSTAPDDHARDEVYMEVARKESTLTDVDNELAGLIRRHLE